MRSACAPLQSVREIERTPRIHRHFVRARCLHVRPRWPRRGRPHPDPRVARRPPPSRRAHEPHAARDGRLRSAPPRRGVRCLDRGCRRGYHRLNRENARLRTLLRGDSDAMTLLRKGGRAMTGLCDRVEKVSASTANVLLLGESDTGKELVARAIHERSERASGPFVTMNVTAVPDSLVESCLQAKLLRAVESEETPPTRHAISRTQRSPSIASTSRASSTARAAIARRPPSCSVSHRRPSIGICRRSASRGTRRRRS